MNLYLENKEIEVKLKPFISPKMKGEAVDLIGELSQIDPRMKMQKRMIELAQKFYGDDNLEGMSYQDLIKSGKLSKEEMKELTDMTISADKFSPEVEKQKDLFTIKMFKLLIDNKQVTTEFKEVWDSNDFWQEQDLIGMETEVNSFREKIKCT
jgi:hypothetical protein